MSEAQVTSSTNDANIVLAADIVSAYVSNNNVPVGDLSALINSVYTAVTSLEGAGGAAASSEPEQKKATPAEIRKSITDDYLISFEDGKHYKTLRRHLTLRGLTPEQYRAKHGLAADYPMTSAAYSAQRSQLARDLGLGQQRRKGAGK
jgi:predicted transcriptional regulator